MIVQTPERSPSAAPPPAAANASTVDSRFRRERLPLATPSLLRLLLALSTVLTLLFGVVACVEMLQGQQHLRQATRNAAQLTRVQSIQANLLGADATATNAFLVGGLEAPEQQAAYTRSMSEVAQLILDAGEAQPADREALRALNAEVTAYGRLMEQARSNNRQGFPIGSAYLADAGDHLRTRAMPLLDELVAANDARVTRALAGPNHALLTVLGLLALAALGTTAVLTALRFRRVVNLGLAAALGLVLLAMLVTLSTAQATAERVDAVRTGTLATARASGLARVHAYEAKAYESLTLIARSRGGENEAAWAQANLRARRAIAAIPDGAVRSQLAADWTQHVVSHRKVRELDNDGRWDLARSAATGLGPGSSNATFARFDVDATDAAERTGRTAVAQIAGRSTGLVLAGITALLLCLGAVAAAAWGVSRRLKEYA